MSKWFDTILQTCPDLLKYYDTIWCDSINMSKLSMIRFDTILKTCPDLLKIEMLWYDLIQFYKYVKTCQNTMVRKDSLKWFDTILKTCLDLSKIKRWWNTQKFEWMTDKVTHNYKAIPRTAFDKRAVKNVKICAVKFSKSTSECWLGPGICVKYFAVNFWMIKFTVLP